AADLRHWDRWQERNGADRHQGRELGAVLASVATLRDLDRGRSLRSHQAAELRSVAGEVQSLRRRQVQHRAADPRDRFALDGHLAGVFAGRKEVDVDQHANGRSQESALHRGLQVAGVKGFSPTIYSPTPLQILVISNTNFGILGANSTRSGSSMERPPVV